MKRFLLSCTALVAALSALPQIPARAEMLKGVTAQPDASADVAKYFIDPTKDPVLSEEDMAKLLRKKIKYVFVIFNENHSFDNEFGTFPGANGLYSDGYVKGKDQVRKPEATPGFTQTVKDEADGVSFEVSAFGIGPDQGASAVDSVDHSHGGFGVVNGKAEPQTGLAFKIDVNGNTPAKMDRFAQDEFNKHTSVGAANAPAKLAAAAQYSRLVMSHTDCDTMPFMWKWASNFALFDDIFATEDTPSTPNAIAMIAGQAGETQWVKHGTTIDTPIEKATGLWNGTQEPEGTVADGDFKGQAHKAGATQGVPLVNDPQPFYGSQFDPTTGAARQPSSPTDSAPNAPVASNQTYASLPLTFMGKDIKKTLAGNLSQGEPKADLADIQKDIPYIAGQHIAPVNWRWYQEGYDKEATDAEGVKSEGSGKNFTGNGQASHTSYVLHHNGASYFGYIANTPDVAANLRGMGDFFEDAAQKKLPQGGVFYIRGGYVNQQNLVSPVDTNKGLTPEQIAKVRQAKNGDDDHPGYTDRQLSESMMARVVNAIASDPKLWEQSAIVITYDESDGFYDHVAPRILSYGPDGLPLARGVRVPLLVLSPYARTHVVSHVEGDHNAVIETIEAIFHLPALASLPDEKAALKAGNSEAFNKFGPEGFKQEHLGPRDIPSPITSSLLSGFSPKRLKGEAPLLPASFAKIDDKDVTTLPHFAGKGCHAIGITPEDVRQGITSVIPAAATVGSANAPVKAFNALPGTLPELN